MRQTCIVWWGRLSGIALIHAREKESGPIEGRELGDHEQCSRLAVHLELTIDGVGPVSLVGPLASRRGKEDTYMPQTSLLLTCWLLFGGCDGVDTGDTDADPDDLHPACDRGESRLSERDLSDCPTSERPFVAFAQEQFCAGGVEWALDNDVMGWPNDGEVHYVGVDTAAQRLEVHTAVQLNRSSSGYTSAYLGVDVTPATPFIDGETTQVGCESGRWAIALYDNDTLSECWVLHPDGWGNVGEFAPEFAPCGVWRWF